MARSRPPFGSRIHIASWSGDQTCTVPRGDVWGTPSASTYATITGVRLSSAPSMRAATGVVDGDRARFGRRGGLEFLGELGDEPARDPKRDGGPGDG